MTAVRTCDHHDIKLALPLMSVNVICMLSTYCLISQHSVVRCVLCMTMCSRPPKHCCVYVFNQDLCCQCCTALVGMGYVVSCAPGISGTAYCLQFETVS
jgi:hypothetical protein